VKWFVGVVVVLLLSMCACAGPDDSAPGGQEPGSSTTTVSPSTTRTTVPQETTVASEPSTTLPTVEVPDLSGVWDGELTGETQPQSGTVLISQDGMAFSLQFSEGFDCRPDDACDFDGVVEPVEDEDGVVVGYSWLAGNAGVADDEGGTYESQFRLAQAIDPEDATLIPDVYEGAGHSEYHHPSGEIAWDTYVIIRRRK
jgi:hypothetical protein